MAVILRPEHRLTERPAISVGKCHAFRAIIKTG